MNVRYYRDLVVWQKAMDAVELVYRASERFPKTEIYGLSSQIRRAVVSVPSNIVEGQGRRGTKEFLKHLTIVYGSLLVAGDIKLKVSGREVTVNGQQAVDALKSNRAFKTVGVALRHDKVAMEVLALAAQRLTDLIGEMVVPLEPDICKAAAKYLPQCQHRFAPLAEKLDRLDLPRAARIRALNQQIADLLFTDASDAPQQFGAKESSLYNRLQWAQAVKVALEQGLETTIWALRRHQQVIAGLPTTGVPGRLRSESADDIDLVTGRLAKEDFFKHAADLKRIPEWAELTREEQNNALDRLTGFGLSTAADLAGFEQFIAHEFDLQLRLSELKERIIEEGRERQRQRVQEQKKKEVKEGKVKPVRSIEVLASLSSVSQIEELISELQTLKAELSYYDEFELRIFTTESTELTEKNR